MNGSGTIGRVAADRRWQLAGLVAAALLAAFAFLGRPDFWGHHIESRRAEIAREMSEPGANPLVPTLNGRPILTKPPVVYWLQAGSYRLTGGASEWAARLPGVLLGLAQVLVVFLIGREWRDRRTGLIAAAVTLSTVLYFQYLRYAEIDMSFAALTTGAAWCVVRGLLLAEREEYPRPGGRTWWWFTGGWALAGVGFMIKGPYALLFPLLGLVAAAVARRRWRLLLLFFVNPGVVAFFAIVLPWFVYVYFTEAGAAAATAARQVQESLSGEAMHRDGPWFYLVHLTIYAPWFFLVPPALWQAWKEKRLTTIFLCWMPLLGMAVASFVPAKKEVYILPLWPAFALLTADLLRRLGEDTDLRRTRAYGRGVLWGVLGLAGVGAVALGVAPAILGGDVAVGAILMALLVLAVLVVALHGADLPTRALWLSIALLCLYGGVWQHVLPLDNDGHGVKRFARELNAHIPPNVTLRAFGDNNYSIPFYARRIAPDQPQLDREQYIVLRRKDLPRLAPGGNLAILLENREVVGHKVDSKRDWLLVRFTPGNPEEPHE